MCVCLHWSRFFFAHSAFGLCSYVDSVRLWPIYIYPPLHWTKLQEEWVYVLYCDVMYEWLEDRWRRNLELILAYSYLKAQKVLPDLTSLSILCIIIPPNSSSREKLNISTMMRIQTQDHCMCVAGTLILHHNDGNRSYSSINVDRKFPAFSRIFFFLSIFWKIQLSKLNYWLC